MADTPISSLAELTTIPYSQSPLMAPVVDTADTTMASTGTTKKLNLTKTLFTPSAKSSAAILIPVTANTTATLTNAPIISLSQNPFYATFLINLANSPITFTTNNDMALRFAAPSLLSFNIYSLSSSKGFITGGAKSTVAIGGNENTTIDTRDIEFIPIINLGSSYPNYFGLRLCYKGNEIIFKANQTVNLSYGSISGSFFYHSHST